MLISKLLAVLVTLLLLLSSQIMGLVLPLASPSARSGLDPYWAQAMVKAEPMKLRVGEILARSPDVGKVTPVPIVVLDTGLHKEIVDYLHSNGSVHTKGFHRSRHRLTTLEEGDVEYKTKWITSSSDPGNHGTSVASLIAAEGPVGMVDGGISLAVYQASVENSMGALLKQAQLACTENSDPEGITIINLSMGFQPDEGAWDGGYRDEDHFSDEIYELGESGCLIVKASGNQGYRGQNVNQLSDAYLRVESVGRNKKVSRFSSIGEVSAPGESVLTLGKSEELKKSEGVKSEQLSIGYRKFTGTSFAAPIVSGIAAQVVRVLKSGPSFRYLKPVERIALVNRIIKGSEVDGVVNGLVAVNLAASWNENFSGG